MKIIIISIFILLALNVSSNSQQWQKTIGGVSYDDVTSVKQTTDGGYIITGYTSSFGSGNSDMYIVKLDAAVNLQWTKTIGGAQQERCHSVQQTSDGGYIVTGYTSSYSTAGFDIFTVKLDASGNILWNKVIGGILSEEGNSIQQTTDGGYIIGGVTNSFGAGNNDAYVVKLDVSGNLVWAKTIGGASSDRCVEIRQTTDGGYFFGGYTLSFGQGNSDFYAVKLDASGNLQWSKTIGGSGNEYCNSVKQTTDGGYILSGNTTSFGAGGDVYAVKLDASGSLIWARTVGGTDGDGGYSVIQTTEGGFVILGFTISFGLGIDMYLAKLDTWGNLQWSKSIGGQNEERGFSIIQLNDGGYLAAGFTSSFGAGSSDIYLVRLDANAVTCSNILTASSQTSSGGSLGSPNTLIYAPTVNSVTVAVSTNSGGASTTLCLVGIKPVSNEIPVSYFLNQNYPNPFNPASKIRYGIPLSGNAELKVFDITGREMAVLVNEHHVPGIYEAEFDWSHYSSGVYFYTLKSGEFAETKKMILTK